MTSYVLRFLGVKIFTLDVIEFDLVEEDEAVPDTPQMLGGSAHNFERDFDPLIPGAEKDYESWVERPFGFRRL